MRTLRTRHLLFSPRKAQETGGYFHSHRECFRRSTERCPAAPADERMFNQSVQRCQAYGHLFRASVVECGTPVPLWKHLTEGTEENEEGKRGGGLSMLRSLRLLL
jgi:hypothetical protein